MSKNLENIIIATRVDDLSVADTISEIMAFIKEQTHEVFEPELAPAVPQINDYANGWNDCRQSIRVEVNRRLEKL